MTRKLWLRNCCKLCDDVLQIAAFYQWHVWWNDIYCPSVHVQLIVIYIIKDNTCNADKPASRSWLLSEVAAMKAIRTSSDRCNTNKFSEEDRKLWNNSSNKSWTKKGVSNLTSKPTIACFQFYFSSKFKVKVCLHSFTSQKNFLQTFCCKDSCWPPVDK